MNPRTVSNVLRYGLLAAVVFGAALKGSLVAQRSEAPRQPMEFVKISPGEFMMGCSAGDDQCRDDEMPAHKVRITKGFEIGKYEVTQAQWTAVMGSNPSHFKGPNLPVEQVSWNDAQQFIQKMNEKHEPFRYRLPTEAEWEYAARAGATAPVAGSLDAMAWYSDNSDKQTHPIGKKQPNAWGLYDMLGNVSEWVQDWWSDTYYAHSPASDPSGPATGQFRVLRGGAWDLPSKYNRVSARNHLDPVVRNYNYGFRCVREPNP